MSFIFHITSSDAWTSAGQAGEYRADTLETEGFIHCSTSDQLLTVANALYHGQHGLVLLCINPDSLRSELRYEKAAHPVDGIPPSFPHIYGPLNLDAVLKAVKFEPGPDGRFTVPGRTVQFSR